MRCYDGIDSVPGSLWDINKELRTEGKKKERGTEKRQGGRERGTQQQYNFPKFISKTASGVWSLEISIHLLDTYQTT